MDEKAVELDKIEAEIKNIINHLNFDCVVSNKTDEIQKSTHLILPGVGAFGKVMEKINKNLPIKFLEHEIFKKKKLFLGICIGMQVLAEIGEEFGINKGLGWIPGKVEKMRSKKLPHIGWNEVNIIQPSILFNGFKENRDFYFVNSFHFNVKDTKCIIAKTDYDHSFCSAVRKENIFGTQFHPEKSQQVGQLLLKNFINYNG